MKQIDKTSLAYWFPLIEAAGIPVPKTKFIQMTPECRETIWAAFDGKDSEKGDGGFFEQVAVAAKEIGYPVFLRTGQTSAKHSWKNTCFLPSESVIKKHVMDIVEFSECADIVGLDWGTWVVREMLPTIPYGRCSRYGDFPVCKEFRFFVDDGKFRCSHPYWPLNALQEGNWEPDVSEDVAYKDLCSMHGCKEELITLAEKTGKAVGGSWSIDILETERGWYVTDMAEAHKSFHWEGCEHA
jgi:hypothetical protein